MAPRLTTADKTARLVEATRQRVDKTPWTTRLLRHMPSSKLEVLVHQAGYERRSDKMLTDLSSRFRAAGIDFSPELVDPANGPNTRIYFFDAKRRVQGLQSTRLLFKKEAELSRFLTLNSEFLTYATKHLQIIDREKELARGAKIDLLAIDRKTRELVGIELKVEEASQGIVGQAAKYMKSLKAQAEKDGRRGARLLIITGQPDEELEEMVQVQAEKIGVKTDWMLYSVRFELHPPSEV